MGLTKKQESRWLAAANKIGMGEVTRLPGSYGRIHPEWERVSLDWGFVERSESGDSPGELECYDGKWRDPLGTEREVRAVIAHVGDDKRVFYFGDERPSGSPVIGTREDAIQYAAEWTRSR